jgi:hypothetical protein
LSFEVVVWGRWVLWGVVVCCEVRVDLILVPSTHYRQSETPFTPYGGANMTEIFYHESTNVHPHITRYPGFGELHGAACPCIDVGAGILKNDWASDAEYVSVREFDAAHTFSPPPSLNVPS